MRQAIIFVLLSAILVACGGATPTPDISAIQTEAVQDAIATLTAQAPTATAIPTNTPTPTNTPIPTPTDTPIPSPTNTPTRVPSPTATKSIETYGRVGERVESGGWALTVHSVTREPTEDTSALPPKPMVFVSIELTLENTTGDYLQHNWLSYSLVDNKGQGAGPIPLPPLFTSEPYFLFIESLGGGQKISGSIGFTVSPDSMGLTLVYQPFVGQRGFTPIRISLD